MSVTSASYYWVTCDAPDCGADSRLFDHAVYEKPEDIDYQFAEHRYEANTLSDSHGWVATDDGRHYCHVHTKWDDTETLRIPNPTPDLDAAAVARVENGA